MNDLNMFRISYMQVKENDRELCYRIVDWNDGSRSWHINGELHREDGPAWEDVKGTKQWWLDGEQLSEKVWKKRVAELHKKNIDNPKKECYLKETNAYDVIINEFNKLVELYKDTNSPTILKMLEESHYRIKNM